VDEFGSGVQKLNLIKLTKRQHVTRTLFAFALIEDNFDAMWKRKLYIAFRNRLN
jgi:hypothetical protein